MPRVFVACHDPSRHGKVTWEGHDIVGYVDVTPGTSVGDAPYFNGWDSIPASLRGTIDIVLGIGCPIAINLQSGSLTSFADKPSAEDGEFAFATHDIFTKGFTLLKPGGSLLFPRIRNVAPQTLVAIQKTLPPGTNTAAIVDIPKPRWMRHRQEETYDVNEDYSKETVKGLQVTKGLSGGRRRRKTRRTRRRRTTRRR